MHARPSVQFKSPGYDSFNLTTARISPDDSPLVERRRRHTFNHAQKHSLLTNLSKNVFENTKENNRNGTNQTHDIVTHTVLNTMPPSSSNSNQFVKTSTLTSSKVTPFSTSALISTPPSSIRPISESEEMSSFALSDHNFDSHFDSHFDSFESENIPSTDLFTSFSAEDVIPPSSSFAQPIDRASSSSGPQDKFILGGVSNSQNALITPNSLKSNQMKQDPKEEEISRLLDLVNKLESVNASLLHKIEKAPSQVARLSSSSMSEPSSSSKKATSRKGLTEEAKELLDKLRQELIDCKKEEDLFSPHPPG